MVVTDATGAEAVGLGSAAGRPSRIRSAPSNRAGSATSSTAHRDVVAGWPPGCRPGCGAVISVRSASTATACGCGWKATDGDRDIRLPFHTPVDDVTGLGKAIRLLIGCPFANGLRARAGLSTPAPPVTVSGW